MPGETRTAVFAQPDWLRRVPVDRRLPEGARVLHIGCGTSFHAAQTGGRKGGGAQLPSVGLAVVSRFRAIERAAAAAAATHMAALQAEIDAG